MLTALTNLFQSGNFTLKSGKQTDYLIDCSALTPNDWETLALMAYQRLPAFGKVEGVPRGGIPFAKALEKYIVPNNPTLLIAEDVVTTGGSMNRLRDNREAIGVCVFARGALYKWITPIFKMGE